MNNTPFKCLTEGAMASLSLLKEPCMSLLTDHQLIKVEGIDGKKFLQGQLSNDLNQLKLKEHHLTTASSPKGKMYASFRLLNTENYYGLILPKALVENFTNTLNKYIVFFKAELKVDQSSVILALSGEKIKGLLESLFNCSIESNGSYQINTNTWLLRVDHEFEKYQRYQLVIPHDQLAQWVDLLKPHFQSMQTSHWDLLNIHAVVAEVKLDCVDQYIPQHFNFNSLKGISFRKGCYTGQEIIARMQNLGQLKKRLYHLIASECVELRCNDKLLNNLDKPIGEVVHSVTPSDSKKTECLAVIRTEYAEKNEIFFNKTVQFKAMPLPYITDIKKELQQ